MIKSKIHLGVLSIAVFILLITIFSCENPTNSVQQKQDNPVYQKSLKYATENISSTKTDKNVANENEQESNRDDIYTFNNSCRTQSLYYTCQNTCNLCPTCNRTCSGSTPTCLGYPTCSVTPTVCLSTCTSGCGTK